ncbi:MAG: aldo/keto reductase [Anaerolineae bacterium]|nr:aldo/keto reductase [Anaerolineae bacterium]MCA9893450.1 aldo/keto reductase [Anaerolineae bacterium]
MEYGKIPGIEKSVSRLVQGTVPFMLRNQDDAFVVYDSVFEHGINTFDTAHGYGKGECEQTLGAWINSRGLRDQIVILDKGAHPYNGRNRVTPEDITSDIEDSLERLGTDYIDLYVLHRDDENVPVAPIVTVLNEHLKAGRIHAFGGSNWSYQRLKAANDYAAQTNQTPFVVSSPHFSVAEMVKPAWEGCISIAGDQGAAAREWYAEHDITVFTWASLSGGFMTGRFRRDNLGTFSEYADEVVLHAYCYEDNFRRLDRAEALAAYKGISITQLALAYVLSHPLKVHALVGAMTTAEVAENITAFDHAVSDTERAWLELQTDEQPF